jgi:hypothetical protein
MFFFLLFVAIIIVIIIIIIVIIIIIIIIIIKWLMLKGNYDMDCIRLVRERALVNRVMNIAIS